MTAGAKVETTDRTTLECLVKLESAMRIIKTLSREGQSDDQLRMLAALEAIYREASDALQ